jgi:hypothetical protein
MSCPHEERVTRTAAASPDDPWLAEHARACADCAGLIEMSRWMLEMEGDGVPETADAGASVRIPSAGQIWWKAQVAAREVAANKALRPLRLVESATVAAALVGAGGALFVWLRGLPGLLHTPARLGSEMAAGTVSAGLAVAAGIAVFITTVAVHRLLARD